MTDQEMLDAIRAAIHEIVKGDGVASVGGREYTRRDLATLHGMERTYQRRVQRAKRGGIRVRRVVPRG